MERKKKRSSSLNELQTNQVTFGDYIIKETIGKGTFSKVKLGLNKITGEKVAIKILDKSKILEKEDLDRVIREMSILSKMDHENVIKVFQIYEDSKNFLIIMEYCEGGELFNYIVKKGRLSEKEASFFFYQIINGIEYIFSKGIAHRDLKPENLLLNKNNVIKIIDFGLSNFFDGEHNLVTPCGSPCYASPEMVSGSDYNGFYIDIWATGIILFAMTCGYLPFEDPDNDKLFELILKAKLEFPSHLSETCKDLIKKILVTDPHKRITINKIKEHEFYLMGKGEYNALFNRKKNKLKIKKHNSDNYLNNINIKNINNEYEINYNNNHNEVKTINNINTKKENNKTEINTRSNSKDKIKNLKKNNNENSENTNKVNNYITSNRVGKYKIKGFKFPNGLLNNIKSEKTSKGLVTEANIDINRIKDMQINGFNIKNDLNSLKHSIKSSERPKIFLKNKINIQKLTQIKKFPLKFNLTELTNNYINTKIFSRIKNAKREKNNINNIALINSMNSKNKPLIIDNALINININSNKYIIGNIGNDNTDFRIKKNKEKNEGINNKKIKSKTPTVLRFYNYNFPNIKKDEIININKNNDIFSNRLRLKTDYNNFKNNDYLESNLKTINNIGHNKDSLKYKLNHKLRFNKIYSFLHNK